MAYKQNPGRGNGPKTGGGIPTPFKQVKSLPSDSSTSKSGNSTTTNTSYGKKAINAVKNATDIEFTKEGMQTLAPSSTSKNTELNLGKYKDYVQKSTVTPTGSGETTQTYQTKKDRVENPARRAGIESYVRDLNPGKKVQISDWK